MSTPILPFAVWDSGTNQNAVPANDNSLRNEILNGLVLSASTNAQPGSPSDGAIYIMTGAATGTQWATFDQYDLAIYKSGTWKAFAPVSGIVVNVAGTLKRWNGSAYVDAATGGGGGSGTDLGWLNVKDAPYNAAGDGTTDDTTAIQDAIDDAAAAGGGTIYFPPGVYVVNGALQDGSGANAQLLLPSIDYLDSEAVTIKFVGCMPPPCIPSVVGSTPLPDGHSIIKGTLNTGSGGGLLGGYNSGGLDNFTNVFFQARDITFRMPSNPVLSALKLNKVAAIDLDNVVVDCGSYNIQGLTEPTTSSSFGIICPGNNNGAYTRIGAATVIGFYNGYEFAEHSFGQMVAAHGCKRAYIMATATNHGSKFDRLLAQHCQRGIVATGDHFTRIGQFDIEHAASGWWITAYDVDDSSSYLHGSLEWHVVLAGVGPDVGFLANGAARCDIKRLGFANGVQIISISAAATFEGVHANKTMLHPSADTTARTWTIPANSSVPYPVGTCLTFVNQASAGTLTIGVTSDTMRLAGAGSTGNRTLAANGMATAVKVASTEWIISGTGLT